MKKTLTILFVFLLAYSCKKDDHDKASGWIKYKGVQYDLHMGTYGSNPVELEGLYLHATVFNSMDASTSVAVAFYSKTTDIETGTYSYTGSQTENGSDGELVPASIQILNKGILLPNDLKSGEFIIKKSDGKYEFTFNFTTSDSEVISGFFNGKLTGK